VRFGCVSFFGVRTFRRNLRSVGLVNVGLFAVGLFGSSLCGVGFLNVNPFRNYLRSMGFIGGCLVSRSFDRMRFVGMGRCSVFAAVAIRSMIRIVCVKANKQEHQAHQGQRPGEQFHFGRKYKHVFWGSFIKQQVGPWSCRQRQERHRELDPCGASTRT